MPTPVSYTHLDVYKRQLASLAISASAANTVDASGGTGTSSVTLSSTADGSIGGDPAATKMSVTVPVSYTHLMMKRTLAMAVLVTASLTGVTMAS